MKKLFLQFFFIATSIVVNAGEIKLDKGCEPKEIFIKIYDNKNQLVIEKNITNPENGTPIDIKLNPLNHFRDETTVVPANIHCHLSTKEGKINSNPDLICMCTTKTTNEQSTSINMKPGKWQFSSSHKLLTLKHLPFMIPHRSYTECVQDPYKRYNVNVLSEVDDANCPYVLKVQKHNYGEWKRKGKVCRDIRGIVKYDAESIKIDTYYTDHGPASPDFVISITGKRIGDCKK